MFETVAAVVRALKTFRDFYHPKSSSILLVSNESPDPDADPFRRGFLASLEERTELLKRLAALDERERAVVMLWYVADLPVREICAKLSLSRSHCYRIRNKALQAMAEPDVGRLEVQEAFA